MQTSASQPRSLHRVTGRCFWMQRREGFLGRGSDGAALPPTGGVAPLLVSVRSHPAPLLTATGRGGGGQITDVPRAIPSSAEWADGRPSLVTCSEQGLAQPTRAGDCCRIRSLGPGKSAPVSPAAAKPCPGPRDRFSGKETASKPGRVQRSLEVDGEAGLVMSRGSRRQPWPLQQARRGSEAVGCLSVCRRARRRLCHTQPLPPAPGVSPQAPWGLS